MPIKTSDRVASQTPLIRSAESRVSMAPILIGVIGALYFARGIFIPLAFAITLTLVLAPAVGWLQRLHVHRFPAALLVMIASLASTGAIGYLIFDQVVQVVNELPGYRENIDRKIQMLRSPGSGSLGRAAQSARELGKELAAAQPPIPPGQPGRIGRAGNPLPVQVVEAPANSLAYARSLTEPLLAPMAIFGVVLVFTLFLLADEADLRNRIFRLAGLDRLNVMTQALEDGTRRVSRYLMLQFLVNAGFGILCGAGLYLIGVPYAALWGAVAALFRIVPYVGSMLSGLLPLLLSLAVFESWIPPLLVFLLFAALELITANLLEPWLYGAHTGISSLALLLTTVFWGALWGPAGLILSTPLTVCVVVLGRHIPHLSFLHILLGDQAVLAPEARLYQRLLAMDDQQARAVAAEYRSRNSLLQLYDGLLLPALTMVEQDRHKGALDPQREEFVFLSVREMLAEFSEEIHGSFKESAEELSGRASSTRFLCFSAHDEADEIAVGMLAQLLEQAGYGTVSFPLDSFRESMLDLIGPTENDVFCISAVPPFAFSHARSVYRQLRTRFPQTKILVGVWGFSGETERALQRFQPSPPDKIATSLADAMEYLGAGAGAPVEAFTPQPA